MARILITGSAQGLGRNAATTLLDDGHQVVVHARSHPRAEDLADLAGRGADIVVGNLASLANSRPATGDRVVRLGSRSPKSAMCPGQLSDRCREAG